jgi:hypothetical protein
MLSNVADRIANFKDDDTKIITVVGAHTVNNMKSDYRHTDIGKNLIIYIADTTVMGSIALNISSGSKKMFETIFKDQIYNDDAIGNDEYTSIASVVNNIKNMKADDTIVVHYPTLDNLHTDQRLKTSVTKDVNQISSASLNDALTPGGKNILIVIEKNNDPVLIDMSRPSYIEQLCPKCPTSNMLNEVSKVTVINEPIITTRTTRALVKKIGICILLLLIFATIFYFYVTYNTDVPLGADAIIGTGTPIDSGVSSTSELQELNTIPRIASIILPNSRRSLDISPGTKLGRLRNFL